MGGGGGSSRSGGASAALLLAAAHQTQRQNRCYSFFFEPRNFTAQCDEQPMNTHGIGLVPCRGICLSLAQEFVIMAFFAEFDMCREVLASELFRLSSNNKIGGRSVEHLHGGSSSSVGGGSGAGGLMDSQPILEKEELKKYKFEK
uniref:Uncharacterized protein n=1 Tax=Meloidogyne floridensis TaxID=298350 RepID=A0A915PFB6_9BILA